MDAAQALRKVRGLYSSLGKGLIAGSGECSPLAGSVRHNEVVSTQFPQTGPDVWPTVQPQHCSPYSCSRSP